MRHLAFLMSASTLTVALAACDGGPGPAGPGPAVAAPAAPRAGTGVPTGYVPRSTTSYYYYGNTPGEKPRAWLDPRGTSIVGFGILRLVPAGPTPAAFRIRYREVPDGYATTGNLQLFVLPADAFATKDRAYADEFLVFARTDDEAATDASGALRLEVRLVVERETTVLVCYGPWTAPDAGRPAGDVPTFSVDVAAERDESGSHEWLESEAGEMITTNWSSRPEIAGGGATPFGWNGGQPTRIEVRPMILYDGRRVRATGEPDTSPDADAARALRAEATTLAAAGKADLAADRRERADDLEARIARSDLRLVLTPALAEKFRRVPIRWR